MRTVEEIQKQFIGDKQTWDQSDLQRLIDDHVEERLDLDYKGPEIVTHDKKHEITKVVSAMANAAGGVVIFGISETREKNKAKHLAEKIDPISRTKYSREWLGQIVNQIQPPIAGLRINPVPINESHDEVVYVVVVPQSHTVHQATDLKYYHRHADQSIGMHHYQVTDVMNRMVHPIVRMSFEVHEYLLPEREFGGQLRAHYNLVPTIRNAGTRLAQYVLAFATIPLYLKPDEKGGEGVGAFNQIDRAGTEGHEYRFSNLVTTGPKGAAIAPYFMPLLPGMSRPLKPIPLHVGRTVIEAESVRIFWQISADNAPLQVNAHSGPLRVLTVQQR